jgi:hypothetical protein
MPRGFRKRLWNRADRMYARQSRGDPRKEDSITTNNLLRQLLHERVLSSPRYQEPKRLLRHGFKVYAHFDEDGLIEEIFRRVGVTNRFFVEFGCGFGLMNDTVYLLLQGWQGVWLEGSSVCCEAIGVRCEHLVKAGRLRVKQCFITAENIEELFSETEVPAEFDLLCIDIDNNDYWVWKAVQHYRPRVVAIEYNASFRHSVSCVVPYDPMRVSNRTNYFGASLKALEELGRQKGYCLVGCNYVGTTAFFVRQDVAGDHFAEPYTAENHYEPPRYPVRVANGHPPWFGPVVLNPEG